MKRNQKLKGDGETVSCVIEKWEARKIKRLAEKKGLSVSATIRILITAGLVGLYGDIKKE